MDSTNSETTPESTPRKITVRRSTRIIERRNSIKMTENSYDSFDEENEASNSFDDSNTVRHRGASLYSVDDKSSEMYSFKTPKKRNGMIAMAMTNRTPKTPKLLNLEETPKKNKSTTKTPSTPTTRSKTPSRPKTPAIPKTPKTPRSSSKLLMPKTPKNIRLKIKRDLEKSLSDEDFEDFNGSDGDDYVASETDDESTEDTASSNNEDDSPVQSKPMRCSQRKQSLARNTKVRTQQELVFESDKYFRHQSGKKIGTSNNTLERLKNPRMKYEDISKLLTGNKSNERHKQCIENLQTEYKSLFPKWLLVLSEGYNIVLYGLGSKRNILQEFHSEMLSDENVLVVNGCFPSLTINEIVRNISDELLDITAKSKNLHEMVDIIAEDLKDNPDYHIFLIIHNLDGVMLRNEMAQNILSRLANIKNIHLITSIDHINTPQLWDNIQLNSYNFSWWDTTTFLPYTYEISIVDSTMLVEKSSRLSILSMKNVFQALTNNARGIYMLIAKNQLAHSKSSNFQGISFNTLYRKCIDQFLVTSPIVLRTQLTEFYDHDMLNLKRGADGIEYLKIRIDNVLLQQFVDQHDN